MAGLTKEQILGADDRPLTPVNIPEWNGDVFIRIMSGSERDSFELESLELNKRNLGLKNIRARLAVRVVCSEDGKRLFDDSDAGVLGEKCGGALDRIFEAAQTINKMSDDDIKELEKN